MLNTFVSLGAFFFWKNSQANNYSEHTNSETIITKKRNLVTW